MDNRRSLRRSGHRGRAVSQDTSSHDSFLEDDLLPDRRDRHSSVSEVTPDYPDYTLPDLATLDLDDSDAALVISIDYGTTNTGVAWSYPAKTRADLAKIQVTRSWAENGVMTNMSKVPSVYSYSPASNGELQWGSDLSKSAVTMINTKLELDAMPRLRDELELTLQLLEATKNLSYDNIKKTGDEPEYTWKSPEAIVADYMHEIFGAVYPSLGRFAHDKTLRERTPVDLVVTVPVNWSYQARNSTLKAITKAGFNHDNFPALRDVIMISEPEAAALYTARYYREVKKADFLQTFTQRKLSQFSPHKRILQAGFTSDPPFSLFHYPRILTIINECFILCDAGGGTVDCVSYQVTQLEPLLELKKVTLPTSKYVKDCARDGEVTFEGDKCGATYISENFKHWLRSYIGDRYYRHLDPHITDRHTSSQTTESGNLRELMAQFEAEKRRYPHEHQKPSFVLSLPNPLNALNIPGKVKDGEIVITMDLMKSFFNPCVSNVIKLITGQVQQIAKVNRRTRNVFLIGGFGESPYLRQQLEQSLKMRKLALRRMDQDTAWTAVVCGAAMYGIEKTQYKGLRLMHQSSRSYGIVINEAAPVWRFNEGDHYVDASTNTVMIADQFSWLVRQGDLIMSDEALKSEKDFTITLGDNLIHDLPIYVYNGSDDDVPDRWQTGQHEVTPIEIVKCNLTPFSMEDFYQYEDQNTGRRSYTAHLVCKLEMSLHYLLVEVFFNNVNIGQLKIKVDCTRPDVREGDGSMFAG